MSASHSVLIVDDEPEIRDGVARWLNCAGYQTCCVGSGDAGIQSAQESTPDAILLDVLMPHKDGMATLAELRADRRTSQIPVIMLSASLRDTQRALDSGATCFLPKPYDGKKLLTAIAAVIATQQEKLSTFNPPHDH